MERVRQFYGLSSVCIFHPEAEAQAIHLYSLWHSFQTTLMCLYLRWVCWGWACSNRDRVATWVAHKEHKDGEALSFWKEQWQTWMETEIFSSMVGSARSLLVTSLFAAVTSDTFSSLCGLLAYAIIFHSLCSLTFQVFTPLYVLRTESHANVSALGKNPRYSNPCCLWRCLLGLFILWFPSSLGKKMPPIYEYFIEANCGDWSQSVTSHHLSWAPCWAAGKGRHLFVPFLPLYIQTGTA